MVKTAVIMAAGKGTRFGNRTADMPKGFIEFKGKPMIERSIENLLQAGIEKIIIGTGYHSNWYDQLKDKYPQIVTVYSPEYADTNSMETLYICHNEIGNDDFLLLESDIVYERKALNTLLKDPHPNIMLVTPVTKFQDQYYVGVDSNTNLKLCSVNKEEVEEVGWEGVYGELVGIHKISNAFYHEMVKDYKRNRESYKKRGYEYEIEDIATSQPIAAYIVKQDGQIPSSVVCKPQQIVMFVLKQPLLQWYEIDDENDLQYAEKNILII